MKKATALTAAAESAMTLIICTNSVYNCKAPVLHSTITVPKPMADRDSVFSGILSA